MSEPLVRRGDEIDDEPVDAAEGLGKGVLLGPDVTPTLSLRRFTLAPGTEVPKHTNEIEHEQYVLQGEYVVGLGDEEHVVRAGDSVHICAVPNGDDSIELV